MRMRSEINSFLAHLRLHYQFLILSGAFLSGAVFSGGAGGGAFVLQFLNVHILLFGGVTVYNSYWDKDTGAIGGMRHPPTLASWTLPASWILQAIGLVLAALVSPVSAAVYAAAMFLFWCYSRPGIRWKGRPLLGLLAIGVGTGVCGFLLGYLHRGGNHVAAGSVAGSLGVACLIVSLFPMSQVYQVEEDLERRDMTFTARYGLGGVRRAYALLFPSGVLLLAGAMSRIAPILGWAFLILGSAAGLGVWRVIRNLRLSPEEYGRVMAVKYVASGLFAAFLAAILGLQARGFFRGI